MIKTAVILAGGKSSRYGRPKGLEMIGGQPLISRLADQIRSEGIDDIYLSADDPDLFQSLGLRIIPDRFQDCGPMAGIHSALMESGAESLLVLACDLPGITSGEIRHLIDAATENPATVVFAATETQEHPLCSVVSREILDPLTRALTEGKCATLRFFHDLDHRTVLFDDHRPFINLNRPEDLAIWEANSAC